MAPADPDHFVASYTGGIAWGTFNREGALNAYTPRMRDALIEFLRRAEQDSAIRCVVLKGAGSHFMAGGDVKDFQAHFGRTPAERRAEFESLCHSMHPIIYLLRRLPKPVLASVRGACAGLGMSFVLASDLAVAAESAFFTLAYVKIGTTPDGGGSFFLPRTVGMKRAMEIALLSDRIPAPKAQEYGLVNWVVPDDQLERETQALAERLAQGATQAIGRTKQLLSSALRNDLETHLQQEALSFAASTVTADMAEGLGAFMEKRAPRFENR
jgi:2-(1,2-epoxy-1,2-dihydrophenyl)acetyl-CoA isomerase